MSEPIYPKLNPTTYLELADELSSRSEPSAKRTAADRAYFSAFLFSRDRLLEKGYVTPYGDERDHQYINEALKRRDILGSFGSQGLRLRRARNVVTYKTGNISTITQQYAHPLNWMLETAREIIKRVDELPTKPRKT